MLQSVQSPKCFSPFFPPNYDQSHWITGKNKKYRKQYQSYNPRACLKKIGKFSFSLMTYPRKSFFHRTLIIVTKNTNAFFEPISQNHEHTSGLPPGVWS